MPHVTRIDDAYLRHAISRLCRQRQADATPPPDDMPRQRVMGPLLQCSRKDAARTVFTMSASSHA